MPHEDASQEPAVGPAVGPEVQPPASPEPHAPRGMAKVLERALAPDLLPPVVTLGDRQVNTASYIAEFADIARHRGPWATTGGAVPWIKPQET
jgi:hypothetical protein